MRILKWHDTSTYRYLESTKCIYGLCWIENEIPQGSWNSWLGNIGLSLGIFSSFWRTEKANFTVSLNPAIEAPFFMSTTARHFGNIKRFKTASDQRYCAFVTLIFSILKACKCETSSVLKPSAQGYMTNGGPFLDNLIPPKCHSV